MNTEQLRYFVSVARYRNFTETAREFYVTQPAVTHQISALERGGGRTPVSAHHEERVAHPGRGALPGGRQAHPGPGGAGPGPPAPAGVLRMLGAAHRLPQFPSRHFLPRLIAAYREAYPRPRGAHPAGRHRHPGGHRRGGL